MIYCGGYHMTPSDHRPGATRPLRDLMPSIRYTERSQTGTARETWAGALTLATSVAVAAQVLPIAPARAQDAPAAIELAPITVTARRGIEQARDVPFGLSVIDGEELQERGLSSLEDALRSTPGVNVNSSGGANVSTLYIRGVGALYPMSMDDTSVAVNIDGNPLTSRHISLGTLDVEQVEILKGPQGTLFGGLGEAGAINITTRKPTRVAEGFLRGEFGEEGHYLTEGAISGPLSDSVSARLAVRASGYDSPITNLQTSEPVSEPDTLAFRGSLLWDVTPDTSVLASAERQKVSHMGENIVLMPYDDDPVVDVPPGIYDDSKKTVERYAVQVDHSFDHLQMTSNTSYVDAENVSPVIYDGLIQRLRSGNPAATAFWQVQDSRERVLTEDLRLSSLPQAPVFWVAGVSLLHSDRSYDHPRTTYGSSTAQFRDFTTTRFGVYGEATVPVAEDWKVTAGLRQTWDDKSFDATYYQGGVPAQESADISDSFTTGRLGLTYAVTPHANLYGMLSRGYNPGGFQEYGTSPGSPGYRAAEAYSAEIGVKAEAPDRRWTINAALFATQVNDNHLLSYDSATYAVSAVNADTRSIGAEVEGQWFLPGGFSLTGGISVVDAEILTSVYGIGDGDVHAGNSVPDIPQISGSLGLQYQQEIPRFLGFAEPALTARLDYQYVGNRPADPQNHFDLDAYHKIDVRIGVADTDGKEVYLWGRNLLDEHYDLYGYFSPPSLVYGAPAAGRVLGAGVKIAF